VKEDIFSIHIYIEKIKFFCFLFLFCNKKRGNRGFLYLSVQNQNAEKRAGALNENGPEPDCLYENFAIAEYNPFWVNSASLFFA